MLLVLSDELNYMDYVTTVVSSDRSNYTSCTICIVGRRTNELYGFLLSVHVKYRILTDSPMIKFEFELNYLQSFAMGPPRMCRTKSTRTVLVTGNNRRISTEIARVRRRITGKMTMCSTTNHAGSSVKEREGIRRSA